MFFQSFKYLPCLTELVGFLSVNEFNWKTFVEWEVCAMGINIEPLVLASNAKDIVKCTSMVLNKLWIRGIS